MTPGPTAQSWLQTKSSSVPTAETGPVPQVSPRFMSVRQGRGGSGQCGKSRSDSARYGSARAAHPCPIFIAEGCEFNCWARLALHGLFIGSCSNLAKSVSSVPSASGSNAESRSHACYESGAVFKMLAFVDGAHPVVWLDRIFEVEDQAEDPSLLVRSDAPRLLLCMKSAAHPTPRATR